MLYGRIEEAVVYRALVFVCNGMIPGMTVCVRYRCSTKNTAVCAVVLWWRVNGAHDISYWCVVEVAKESGSMWHVALSYSRRVAVHLPRCSLAVQQSTAVTAGMYGSTSIVV